HTRSKRDWSSDVCSSDLTCRLYPFTVEYGRNGRSFEYFLCTELPHHWAGGRIHVGNWLRDHFTREDKEYIKAETAFIPLLGETRSEERRVGKECRGEARM